MAHPSPPTPRLLFLDDAPDRAAAFLAAHPGAMWVQTVEQCSACCSSRGTRSISITTWAGKCWSITSGPDCGMAVVRWLCEEPRPHLRDTRFVIHTHNPNAACMMVLHLQVMGFQVQASPFGVVTPTGHNANLGALAGRLIRWLGRHTGTIV